MCLITFENSKIAEEDIICYKILVKRGDTYITPFAEMDITNYVVNNKVWNDSAPEDIKTQILLDVPPRKYYVIGEGFIHTYKHRYVYIADLLKQYFPEDEIVVFKCIIPAGTVYFEGNDDDYCSKSLKFIKNE